MSPLLQVRNLTVLRESVPVLEDVNFTVNAGEYVGIIGPNGGGKTTLLLSLLGALEPSKGQVLIGGKSPKNPKTRERIGLVPQTFLGREFSFPITVEEVVATGLIHSRFWGFLDEKQWKKIHNMIDQVGLTRYRGRPFNELSGGERQRVIIARALVGEPDLLLLDEPFSAVDQPSQADFYTLLSRLNKEEGLTIVLVSHDLEMVAEEVNKVFCLNQRLNLGCEVKKLKGKPDWETLFGEGVKPVHHHSHDY